MNEKTTTEIDLEFHLKKNRREKNMQLLDKIDGYKSYITGVLIICIAVGGFIAQIISQEIAITLVSFAFSIMAVRHSVEKVDAKLTEIMNLGK